MAFKTQRREKKNVPEFKEPGSQIIERIHKKEISLTEENIKSIKIINSSFWKSLPSDYVYSLNFPQNSQLQKIEAYSFEKLNLYSISLPPSLKFLMPDSMKGCQFLGEVKFNKNDQNQNLLNIICDEALKETAIQSIIIPENVKEIGSRCFPISLSEIEFENGAPKLEIVGNYAFSQINIEFFNMPVNIEPFIEAKNVFYRCKRLNTIRFDYDLYSNQPFLSINYEEEEKEKLKRIQRKEKFKEDIQKMEIFTDINEEYLEMSQDLAKSCLISQVQIQNLEVFISNLNYFYFFNTPKLTSISVQEIEGSKFVKKNGILYTADEKKLIVAERNIKSALISSKCQTISNYAFNVKSLKKVSFEKNSKLKEISFLAFYESQIDSLNISDEVDLIDYGAFYKCKKLEKINIPHSIFLIDFFTFSKTNITNITIPKNVIKIKYGSFCSCTKLTAVTFEKESNLIEIDDYAFAFTNIENILIPKKVIRIGDCCFKDCHNLKLIKFENNANILKIGEQCFLGTKIDESQLKKVLQKIDFSLTKKNTDFYYRKEKINTSISISNPLILSNLTQIFIPADVEEIGFHAFCDIQSLIKVKIINISNSKLKIISDSAFFNCKSLKEFEIPNTVKYFGTNSFKNCKNYSVKINLLSNESVIVGKNAFENSDITSFNSESENIIIDDFAFKSCSTLIEFSAKVKEKLFLGKSTFLNCYSLENVTLSPEIKTIKIGECCFMKSSIVEFIIPNNLTKIPDFCFNCCSNLEKVTINKESKITQFGANAFSRSGIEAIFIPPLTKLIDQKCFEKCKKLKDIEISNLLQKCIINEYAFYMTSVKQINIPKSITRIKSGCFENCEKLENITFSNDSLIKKIEFNSFKSTGIQSIILPSSVKYIDEFSFENCRKLQSVTFLGKNVKISSCAFRECNKLENVTFRSKIKIEPTFCDPVLGYTFYIEFKKEEMNDDILKAFFINKEPAFQSFELINSTYSLIINEKFKSFNFAKKFLSRLVEYKKGNYFSLDRKEIIFTDFVNESITIPKDVEIISSNAFTFTNLKKVDFDKNSNLTTIGKFAFQDLLIEEISIPDTVTTIGESSFYNCKKLKKINITKSSQLQEIGSHAFEKSSIETILFPSTLSIINNFAFFECFNLKKVENNSNSINFKYKSFARSSIEIIQFPSESYFSESSFQECKKLKKLVFLNNPTQLVFENNSFTLSGLKRLKIENAEIHENAFDFCKDLHRISLNGKNIKISKNAINYSSIEMISLTIILNKKLKNQQKYFADIINKILISNIEKFCLIMIINSINSTIYVNHKNYVLNNELIYADMIDNTELTDDNNIKRNEILRVSSNITKINFPTMSHIKKIQWPEKCQVEDLGPSGFFSYYNLIEITIPKNVEKISPHLFEHCHFLKMVDFENQSKLTEISEFAFSNTSIENVNLPKSVKIIKQSAFSYNPKLKTVSFDGEIIEKEAFIYTGITTFKLSNNTKIIESNAFQYCHKLNDFMIDIDNSNLSEIGSFAFAESSIKSINIPPKVKTIQKFTFNGCKNLEKVTFSNNSKLETIEEHSFSGNLSLESINIPKTIINLSYKAFINTPSLKSIMNESNQNFVVMKDNSIYSSDKTLVFVPRNLKRFKINEKCLIIHSGSFCGPKLESVSFSDNSLLFIEECGFAHSTKLKEINIPKSILKIGEEAFIDCQNLEKVKFDALCNLIEIPKFCFAFSGIKSINLPNSIEIINQSSFLYCKDLKNINLIDTNTKYIGYSAFSETSIEKVIFPSSIKYIEDHAFEKTKSLKIVDFTNITNIEIWNKEIPKKYIKRMTKMNKKSIISQNNEQNKVIKKVSNSNPVIIKPNETNLNSTKKNVKKSLSLINITNLLC